MRIVVLGIFLKLALIATAHAGDYAYEQVIGFSNLVLKGQTVASWFFPCHCDKPTALETTVKSTHILNNGDAQLGSHLMLLV